MRRVRLVTSLAAAASLALGLSWWVLAGRAAPQYDAEIRGAKAAIDKGAAEQARRLLARAAARRPERGEAQYLLGALEQSQGRPDAARAAWLSVPPGSEFAPHAASMLARRALLAD